MGIPQSIRQRDCRKWYERELLHGHSHLVLLLLFCGLAFIGGLEAFSEHGDDDRIVIAACLLAAGLVGAWALRSYLRVLMRAEFIANQAVCPHCHAYARWEVNQHENHKDRIAMSVCCRDRGHRWRIAC